MELISVAFWITFVCISVAVLLPWIGVVMVRYFDWVSRITEK